MLASAPVESELETAVSFKPCSSAVGLERTSGVCIRWEKLN